MRVGDGAYLHDIASFDKFALKCNPTPKALCVQRGLITAVEGISRYSVDERKPETITSKYPMPQEYAVAAWYKWFEP
jgi:hypothetical protein